MDQTTIFRELDQFRSQVYREFESRSQPIRELYHLRDRNDAEHSELRDRLRHLEIRAAGGHELHNGHKDRIDGHGKRISWLEKAVHGLIYAVGALATSKAGALVDIALKQIPRV